MSALTVAVFPTSRATRTERGSEVRDRGLILALRAEASLRQSLSDPPSITALCALLGTSERTLHEAFREHLGATPKAYLKVLRLNAARQDLLRYEEGRRVTDVALHYGFLHFGWFSQDYRRLFGETPSQTLRRGRRAARRRPAPPAGPRTRWPDAARPLPPIDDTLALGA